MTRVSGSPSGRGHGVVAGPRRAVPHPDGRPVTFGAGLGDRRSCVAPQRASGSARGRAAQRGLTEVLRACRGDPVQAMLSGGSGVPSAF